VSVRNVALGGLLVALVPIAGGAPGHGMHALAPVEILVDGLHDPHGVAVDADDVVFVAERARGTVVRVRPDGSRSVVAQRLAQPFGLAVDAEARLLVTEHAAGRLLRLEPTGVRAVATGLVRPRWLTVADDGTIYVVVRSAARASDADEDDDDLDAIVAVAPDGRVRIFADRLREVSGIVANGRAVYALVRTSGGRHGILQWAIGADGTAERASSLGRRDLAARPRGLARDRLGAFWLVAGDAGVRGVRVRDAVLKVQADDAAVLAEPVDDARDLAFGPGGHLHVTEGRTGRVLRFRPPDPPALDGLPEVVPGTALALRGTATPESRIDVFVDEAEAPVTTVAEADGTFAAVVVIAASRESRLELFATAARGDGLTSTPTRAAVTHDADEPEVAFVRPPAAGFVGGRVDVEVDARDTATAITGLGIEAAGRSLPAVVSPSLPAAAARAVAAWDTVQAPDGAVTLAARAVDRAGNERRATRVVVVDNTPPAVAIVEGPSGDVGETTGTFRFTATDNLAPAASLTFAWRVDEGDFGAFAGTTTATTPPLAPGPHRFEVKARDLAGNESAAAAQTFTVSTGPTITAVVPAAAAIGASVTIVGERLAPGPVAVAFNGVPAAIRRLAATSVSTTVPPGATTGTLTLVTDRGTAARDFEVARTQDVVLRAEPASLRTVAGLPVMATIALADVGLRPFTGLATIRVQQAPDGVTATLGAGALTGGQSTTLTVTPTGLAAPGAVVVEATAVLDGIVVRQTAAVQLDVVPGQHTALGGRLVLVDGTPIAGAKLTLAGGTLDTDAGGNFLFLDPPAGRHMLALDVNAARAGLPIYAIDVELASGVATRLPPLRITPPPPPERFVPIDNATRDQVVTDDRFPGFALTLPAGVTIVGWDGTPKQRIAVERLHPDALPVPPPEFPTGSLYQVFFGTPMGGLPSQPLPISLPNDQHLEPGERAEIWYYDAAPLPGAVAGWRLAGDATVSADGTRAVSDPGVGLARFCGVCGIACIKRKATGQPNVRLNGVRGGDPVDLATGLLVLGKTDLALPGRVPAFLHRVYNAVDPFGGVAGFELSTGPGWTLSADVVLLEDGPDARLLVMPGNARVRLARAGDGTFTNETTPELAGAILHADPDGGHRLVFKDGGTWRFRSGWLARGHFTVLPGLGLLVEQRDRHGNVLTIDRDVFGAVASIAEPAGRTLTFTTAQLDTADPMSVRLVTVLDPLGRVVRYGYDEQRRLATVTDAAGGVVRYAYDTAGRIRSVTDPRGITYLTNEYDAAGRVIRQIQADGGLWRFEYDGPVHAHTRVTVTDPGGGVTTHAFSAGRPVETVDALGQVIRYEHDGAGRVARVVDPLGRTVAFAHDARGNLTQLTDPLDHARTVAYDDADRPRALVDPLQGATRLEYDQAGHLRSAVDPAGLSLTFDVDAAGQPRAITDTAGATTRLEYARTGELIAVVDALGRRTTLDYDAASRLVRRRDPAGGVVSLAYDALDRLVEATDAAGVVRYTWDPNGNLLAVTDPLGRVVRYAYDVMDRRIAKTDALGLTERYEYDAMGRLTRLTDRKGQVTEYEYDVLGRRLVARYADGRLARFTYDAGGRLVAAAEDGDVVLLEYDALDRLTAETTSLGTTRYGWDALGRRASMTRSDGTVTTYAYDAGSRLTRLARGADVVTLEYDGGGRRRRIRLPAGVDAEYDYDAASRLARLTYRGAGGELGTLVYAYDELDRRIAVSGSLAAAVLPEPVASAVYDAANRQLRLGDRELAYDANGNLTGVTGPTAARTFTWDARDRLVATAGADGATAFAYDALGRRAARDRDGDVTLFGYDITDVVEDLSTDRERAYLRGLLADELFAGDGAAVLTDGAGSVLRLVDADGGVRDALSYEPFGRTASTASPPTRYGFTGRERDAGDLYYYRARYYDAGLARFIGEDPLGLAAGINPYVYAFNDPVNLVDPTGLRTYVLHGIWPDRTAFDDFAAALQEADPGTRALPWNGKLFGGVLPSTHHVAAGLMNQILADLQTSPLAATEKLNLVGFSGGGLVAATLAQMLRARGVKVDTVVSLGTPAQSPLTTPVPAPTRLINVIGLADPLSSLRLHPRGSNYLILATHRARSYTENSHVLALVKREIAR
jgi:RHS repeat-associated protein